MALLNINNNHYHHIDAFLHHFNSEQMRRGNEENSLAFVGHERSSRGTTASIFTVVMQKCIAAEKEIVKKIFFDAQMHHFEH